MDGEKWLCIETSSDKKQVVLIVEDSGPGIEKENRKLVFEPFFTTRNGTGIGLSICQRIVMDHGGTIRVDRGRRGGSRFEICFPALLKGSVLKGVEV